VKLGKIKGKTTLFLLVGLIIVAITACSNNSDSIQNSSKSTSNETIADNIADIPIEGSVLQKGEVAPGMQTFQQVEPEQIEPAPSSEIDPITTQTAQPVPVEEVVPTEASEVTVQSAEIPSGEPRVGYLAPDFTLQTIDGQTVQLSALHGKSVVINYWVTWCVPCMTELPILDSIFQDYQDQGMMLLSVNGIEQDELTKVNETVKSMALTYPVLLDKGDLFKQKYWIGGFVPTTFFIDDQGVIREILLGSASEAGFREKIDNLLSHQL
jgi:cytochrome c biogenesis protein CcmG/thiol:disulfide interchange protein DsbE